LPLHEQTPFCFGWLSSSGYYLRSPGCIRTAKGTVGAEAAFLTNDPWQTSEALRSVADLAAYAENLSLSLCQLVCHTWQTHFSL
jgi:hypothetical protein